MISRNTTVLLASFVLCLATAASAQPRWGRERMPQNGACFFSDRNFQGDHFCVRPGEQLPTLPKDMSDKISSIRLMGASEVTVYRDAGMHGRSARFMGDVEDLKREGWNDQISSIDVASRRYSGPWRPDSMPVWGREQVPQEGACFYEDKNFRGRYFCAPRGATYKEVPEGFNDRISSIRVFGGEVILFQDRKFHGKSTEVRNDVTNLKGKWSDKVSSIRVF
jgi:peptidase inhibitor family I36